MEIYTIKYQPFIDWLKKKNTKKAQKCLNKINNGEFEFCVASGYVSVVAVFPPYSVPDYFAVELRRFNKLLNQNY